MIPETPKIQIKDGKKQIFDFVRRKYVALTPEESVRQYFIQYLVNKRNYPLARLAVEVELKIMNLKRRCDIVFFNQNKNPQIVVECKAPEIKLLKQVFEQAAMYNMVLKAEYLCVTNGKESFFCKYNHTNNTYSFINDLPAYTSDIQK